MHSHSAAPSFYGSPQEALQAPVEDYLYLACLHEGTGVNDEPREFSAGPLHVLFAGGDLRYLTVMRDELVRRFGLEVTGGAVETGGLLVEDDVHGRDGDAAQGALAHVRVEQGGQAGEDGAVGGAGAADEDGGLGLGHVGLGSSVRAFREIVLSAITIGVFAKSSSDDVSSLG